MNWFILAFISALFSAASAVYEKKILFSLSALDFSFIISASTLLFSLPFFFSVHLAEISPISLSILFFKTILSAGAFLCVMFSVKNLEISEALPLLALSPGLVAIAGAIFINDILNITEWLGIILMLIGAYFLELRKGSNNMLAPFKVMFSSSKYSYVFIALILFTVTSLLDRILLKEYKLPPYTFMAFQQLFYALIFFVIILIKHRNIITQVKSIDKKVFYTVIAISFFTVIYRYTQIEATKLAPVALVLSIKRLSVLIAVIAGGKLFREEYLYRRVAAVILILSGAALLMNN
ncbi:MAG: EamA family transporter [Ignavibacteriales bacterium]|nr:EamA family transporter [Ignavibacteriales bacterium]